MKRKEVAFQMGSFEIRGFEGSTRDCRERGHSRVLAASSVFAVAGVAVESGLRMSSGGLPGPDLVRAARDS